MAVASFASNLSNCFHTAVDLGMERIAVAVAFHAAVRHLGTLGWVETSFDNSSRRLSPTRVRANDSLLDSMLADELVPSMHHDVALV